jgi:hypothetical protein
VSVPALIAMVAIACAVSAVWYIPNYQATLSYIRSTTNGPLTLGAGPTNPLTFHAVATFTMGMITANFSWILALAGVVGLLASLPKLMTWLRLRQLHSRTFFGVALLTSWAVIPYLSVALGKNQDVRLMAPALPAAAIIVALLVCAISFDALRWATITLTVIFAIVLTASIAVPFSVPGLASALSVSTPYGAASIPLDGQPLGYEMPPGHDVGTPILKYLESQYRARHHSLASETIGVLESDPAVNTNTLGWLANLRDDPFTFDDVSATPDRPTTLLATLKSFTVVLYVPQPRPPKNDSQDRLALVNQSFAADYVRPADLALFPGATRSFALGGGMRVVVLTR